MIRGRVFVWGRSVALCGLLLVTLGLSLAAMPAGRQWLHRIDREWLGERVMDLLARARGQEDWGAASPLRRGQDYGWLSAGGMPVRVAHALGESNTPTANTLGAMQRSYQAGFRIFEVDLVLENGELLCQHDPGLQKATGRDSCKFESLIAALPRDAFLALDIKTDFQAVGRMVVDRLKGTPNAKRVVFQLYRPEDLKLFDLWQREVPLVGPILTAYLSHRRMDYLAKQVLRLGGGVLSLPVERLSALSLRSQELSILLHPIHDANACVRALKSSVQGFYLTNTVRCPS